MFYSVFDVNAHTLILFPMKWKASGDIALSDYILQTLNLNLVAQYRENCKKVEGLEPYIIPNHKFTDSTSLYVVNFQTCATMIYIIIW